MGRLRRQSRTVTAALALVLLILAGFSIGSAQRTRSEAASAAHAIALSDTYSDAAIAVARMEEYEHRYRLKPTVKLREGFSGAGQELDFALDAIWDRGDSTDRALVSKVRQVKQPYTEAIARLFDAIDTGSEARVRRIDNGWADPLFQRLADWVQDADEVHYRESQQTLTRLSGTEQQVFWATVAAFGLGLTILAWLLRTLSNCQRQMAWEAEHDPVTRLPNRRYFQAAVERAVSAAERDEQPTALMVLDLDRFKQINDTLGHHIGDELLCQVGPRLRAVLGEDDLVARLGGDEFGLLLDPPGHPESATTTALTLAQSLRTPFQVADLSLHMAASMGIAVAPKDGRDAETLLRHADVAMYAAKDGGLDFARYDDASDANQHWQLELLAQLPEALEDGQLVLHFQPQVRLCDGVVSGAEALVRWSHPTKGLILPSEFIGIAESSGMIHELTRYVIACAVEHAHRWMVAGHSIPVAVNLSSRCLLDAELAGYVAGVLRQQGLPPSLLKLEVTESAAMTDPVRAAEVLHTLAAVGVSISIDDFGTGNSSLAQLINLPVNELKIDQSFVSRMLVDPVADAIVHTIVDLAARLGTTVVAEGVEAEAVFDALAAHGCGQAQGYLISVPVPAIEFDTFLARCSTTDGSPSRWHVWESWTAGQS